MSAIELREARFEDLEQVAELLRAGAMAAATDEVWQHLFTKNPALEGADPRPAPGWVLQRGDDIGGYIGNLVQRYRYGDRDLLVASATNFIVREDWRGQSLKLVAAYSKQDIELLINSTASPDVSKVFSFLKFSKLLQPDYDNTPFWIGRRAGFLRAALRKKGVPRVLRHVS